MSVQAGIGAPSNYFSQLFILVRTSAAQLVRRPSHSRRAEAARRSARYVLDTTEIGLMPPRGTAGLWPVRILTDFGKSAYVLWLLAGMLVALALMTPRWRGTSRSLLLGLGTRLRKRGARAKGPFQSVAAARTCDQHPRMDRAFSPSQFMTLGDMGRCPMLV